MVFAALAIFPLFSALENPTRTGSAMGNRAGSSSSGPGISRSFAAPPPMTINQEKSYSATIETAQGNIKLELSPQDAPSTVNSFVFLARQGFYNGLTFHRVTQDLVEGGDPNGDGSGGPGYTLDAETNSRPLEAGAVFRPGTNGSQFSIALTPQAGPEGKYTIFGKVTDGANTLSKLAQGDIIAKITIVEE